MHDLSIAILQPEILASEREAKLADYSDRLKALPNGIDLLLLPEMFPTGFRMDVAATQPARYFESHEGRSFVWMQALAQQHDCAVAGSIAVTEGGRNYNRFYLVEPNGASLYYDKRHLFHLAGEDKLFTPGEKRVVATFRGWRVMLQTCFDLRFPESARSRGDYDLLLYAASWPAARDFAWRSLLTARAIENQSYVAAANYVGHDNKGYPYVGHSAILDFQGNVMATLPDGEAGILQANCNAERLCKSRASFPLPVPQSY